MFNKLKQVLHKIPYGLIPMVVIGICMVVGGFITFLVCFKTPISLDNTKDRIAITTLIQEQHPNTDVRDINLCDDVILYPITFDNIYSKSDRINCEEDIYWNTRAVDYTIIKEDTIQYRMIFEIQPKLLHNEIGQSLVIINKQTNEFIY